MEEFDRVIPLPKEAAVDARLHLPVASVRLLLAGCDGHLPLQAATAEHAFELLATLFPAECRYSTDLPDGGLLVVVGLVSCRRNVDSGATRVSAARPRTRLPGGCERCPTASRRTSSSPLGSTSSTSPH